MATASNLPSFDKGSGHTWSVTQQQNIKIKHLLTARRLRPVHSHQGLVTVFAIMFGFLVTITYLETSRMLIPTRVVSKQELRSLTSGFTNDLPGKGSKPDTAWTPTLMAHPVRPTAVFIGFSHCGGKAIASVLASHPDIIVNKKEEKYFTGNLSQRRYLSHVTPSLDHQVTVDVCWSCITNRSAMTRIKSFNETIRVIVVICDPISRLLATYSMQPNNPSRNMDSTKFDLEFLKSKIFVNFSLLGNLNAKLLTEMGDYFRHIVDLYELFSRTQVLIIEKDRFKKNIISELSRLHKFLSVQSHNIQELSYNKDKDTMCYVFHAGMPTCLKDTHQNLTEIFNTETSLLNSLKHFYRPFNRKLFLYLDNKYSWAQ